MNIGILGGTFNPIHLAHLGIAGEAREVCGLDRVLFIPAADPPHKTVAHGVSFTHRLAMVEIAIEGHAGFFASDLEGRRLGKSYSVKTLEILRRDHPRDRFFFIVGLDSFRDITSWRDYEKLFSLTSLVVASRPGIGADPLDLLPVAIRGQFCYDGRPRILPHTSGNSVIFLEETRLDISSTRIRRLVAEGRSIRDLVPVRVADYIAEHRLYRP
jgi:nicotinate-nucleotide adenylyltransferase